MTKRNVMIDILTSRVEMNLSLFEEGAEEIEEDVPSFEEFFKNAAGEMPEPTEMLMEGRLLTSEHRVELVYAESELTGMEGSMTAIGFDRANPELVSMVRTGPVRTAMTFEEGKRHICIYNTPFSEFEVCVRFCADAGCTGRLLRRTLRCHQYRSGRHHGHRRSGRCTGHEVPARYCRCPCHGHYHRSGCGPLRYAVQPSAGGGCHQLQG